MSKDTFVWDDKSAFEFAEFMKADGTNPFHRYWGRDLMNKFKQSKMPKKDKDYEIVEFISPRGGKLIKHRDDLSWEEWGLKSFSWLKIKSVKRLSDGEVFEVGEMVGNKHESKSEIRNFQVIGDGEKMMVHFIETPFVCDICWLSKLPPQSKPEQPKRIDVTVSRNRGFSDKRIIGEYSLRSSVDIPEDKLPAIKAAIEGALNDETDCRVSETTLSAIRQAEEKAWEAARLTHPFAGMRFPTFNHYLIYKSKQ